MAIIDFIWQKKIMSLVNSGDVKELKDYLEKAKNSRDIEFFLSKNKILNSPNDLSFFFDKEGKIIKSNFNIEYCLFYPNFISLAMKTDPAFFETLPENEKNFLKFLNTEIEQGRFYDVRSIFKESLHDILADLDSYFDGKDWTDKARKSLLSSNIAADPNKLSNKIKSKYSQEELVLLSVLYSARHGNDREAMRSARLVRELLFYIDEDEIDKYVIIHNSPFKKYVELNMSDALLKRIIFLSNVKRLMYGENLERLKDKDNQKLLSVLGEKGYKLFMNNNIELDNILLGLGYKFDDIEKITYIKDNKICLIPEVINRLISDRKYKEIIYILNDYFEPNRLNELVFDKETDNKENYPKMAEVLLKLSITYGSLNAEDKESAMFTAIIDNLNSDNSLLKLESEKLDSITEIFKELEKRILNSNAEELKERGAEIIYSLLSKGKDFNYKEALDKIEETFTNRNLPEVARRFLIFMILNDDLESRELFQVSSPTLNNINPKRRFYLLFGDMLRISFGTNNVELKHYFENLLYGNKLYYAIAEKKISLDSLPEEEKELLQGFLEKLCSLYNNTQEGIGNPFKLTGNLLEDLDRLIPLFKPTEDYSLLDRIVRMYGLQAGLGTFKDAMDLMNQNVEKADIRGRDLAKERFSLEEGDMIKGIGGIEFLYSILQNGSLCKEFIGAHSRSDSTPLDTDLSRILEKRRNIESVIEDTKAQAYGPIWFVIKKGKYNISQEGTTLGTECFTTMDEGHMGIRTGFPTTDIDYIMINDKVIDKEKVNFIVALNGIYIPVVSSSSGNLLFTPEEYDELRSKMDGLSYYGQDEFKVSNNLDVPIDYNNKQLIEEARNKRKHINEHLSKTMMDKFGYKLIPRFSTDISLGNVQLIDTGSTGRGTNVSSSSDFDFIMRVDEKADRNEISKIICESFGISYEEAKNESMVISGGNLRLKNVMIPGLDEPVDIDITFMSKADKLSYTTDMALKDRLESIKRKHPDKYEDVLDNIIFAKNYLKEAEAYKPDHSRDTNEGGLGGVGIENWVLQNGGSFYDACVSFMEAATNEFGKMIPFEKFKQKYKIYDFGENFYNGSHDEFVSDNMTAVGYKRMYEAIKKYLKEQKKEPEQIHEQEVEEEHSMRL